MWSRVQQKISLSDLNSDDSDVDPTFINNEKLTMRTSVLEAVINEKEGGSIPHKKKKKGNGYPEGSDSVCLQSKGWRETLINKEVNKQSKIDIAAEVANRRKEKRKQREIAEKIKQEEKKRKETRRKRNKEVTSPGKKKRKTNKKVT